MSTATAKFTPYTREEIEQYYWTRLDRAGLHHAKGNEYRSRCILHGGDNPSSLWVNMETGGFRCFSCDAKGGGIFAFEQEVLRHERPSGQAPECGAVTKSIHTILGTPFAQRVYSEDVRQTKSSGQGWDRRQAQEFYSYTNELGEELYRVYRFLDGGGKKITPPDHACPCAREPKAQCEPGCVNGRVWGIKGIHRVLYHLPDVLQSLLVFIVEGERNVNDLCRALALYITKHGGFRLGKLILDRVAVTTNICGAGGWKQEYEYGKFFAGKVVVKLGDNDEAGRKHNEAVCRDVCRYAAQLYTCNLPVGEGEDISDYLKQHGVEDLLKLLESDRKLYTKPEQDASGLKLKRGMDIVEREQAWEVYDFLPSDTLTTIVGEIGHGKTRMCMSLCADISQGRVPVTGGERADGKRNVLFISNEGAEARLREMFVGMGGDLENLYVEDEDTDLPWNLGDIASLEVRISRCQPAIVVIDSLSTHCPDGVNLWKHSDIAPYLVRLRKLANRHGCAIVLIHHLNKTVTDDPIQKAAGTKGIPGTARHNILVGPDKNGGDNDRIAVTFKTNLARDRNRAFRFQLSPTFQWKGQVTTTAREILRAQGAEGQTARQSQRQQAHREKATQDAARCAEAKTKLVEEILRRASAKEDPILKRAAETYLMRRFGYTRGVAEEAIDDSMFWKVHGSGQGHPIELHLPKSGGDSEGKSSHSSNSAGEIHRSPIPNNGVGLGASDLARPHGQHTGEIAPPETRVNGGDFASPNLPPTK